MVKMVATVPHRYGTRQLKAGDEFDASSSDAAVLRALKKASYAVQKPKLDQQQYSVAKEDQPSPKVEASPAKEDVPVQPVQVSSSDHVQTASSEHTPVAVPSPPEPSDPPPPPPPAPTERKVVRRKDPRWER